MSLWEDINSSMQKLDPMHIEIVEYSTDASSSSGREYHSHPHSHHSHHHHSHQQHRGPPDYSRLTGEVDKEEREYLREVEQEDREYLREVEQEDREYLVREEEREYLVREVEQEEDREYLMREYSSRLQQDSQEFIKAEPGKEQDFIALVNDSIGYCYDTSQVHGSIQYLEYYRKDGNGV